jgi:PAS domain S-box-containing protein
MPGDSRSFPDAATLLRRLAEQRVEARRQANLAGRTAGDAVRAVHELEVHQVELELQNEELQTTRAAAEKLLADYTDLYDFAPVCYLTVDAQGAVLRINRTGARLFNRDQGQLVGQRLHSLVGPAGHAVLDDLLRAIFAEEGAPTAELVVPVDGRELVHVQVEGVRSADGPTCLMVLTDVTERHRAAGEQQRLIVELRQAVAEIRTLKGLIPICASCKKIRDDHGYWEQLESYLSRHSDAQFSHGICPDCETKLYPGLCRPGQLR